MLVLSLFACAPAFDETRKDLEGFRLVAMAAEPVAGGELRALVWSGEGAFHTTAPTVTWTIDGEAAPAPPFTAHVRVESAAGEVEEGELAVAADAEVPVVTAVSREVTDGAATLGLSVEGSSVTRWMSSAGAFVETGPHAADWTLAALPTEDEPEPATPEPGPAAIVALTLDGRGGNTWSWLDVATDAGPYLAVGGRLLPVDVAPADPAEQDWLATITPADTLAGLVLTDLTPAEADPGEVVCGLDPFDADALADGRCGLDEASGARVRLTGAAWP